MARWGSCRLFLRPTLALLVAGGLLLLANALVEPSAPAFDPDPLPYRNPLPADWIDWAPQGFFVTTTGEAVPRPAEGTPFRIFLVGSSALRGDGATRFQSIPGWLQRLLDRQGRPVEVINGGVPGADSGLQRTLLRQALDLLRPDLVVVYGGNNEFLRLRAYRELNPTWNARAERIRNLLERAALYRWLAARLGGSCRPASLEGRSIEDLRARITPDEVRVARRFYRGNLEWMAAACRERGVPLVLCVVAVNEMYPPEYGVPARDRSVAARLRRATPGQAVALLEEEVRRQPGSAWLHFELGRALFATGRNAQAAAELDAAIEADPEPARALPSFAGTVRDTARAERALALDVPTALRRRYGPILGDELFLDFCHFRPLGSRSVAEEILAFLERSDLLPPAAGVGPPPAEDPLDLEAFPRFHGRVFHAEVNRAPEPGSDTELLGQLPQEGTLAGETLRGHLDFLMNRPAEAAARYRRALALAPDRAVLWRNLGHARLAERRPGEALEAWREFLRRGGRDARIERVLLASARGSGPPPPGVRTLGPPEGRAPDQESRPRLGTGPP